ncbi:MAG: response regulator [Candidatus Sericytochromatia bacterium]
MKSASAWPIPLGTRILIVDDRLDNLELLMQHIEESGWPLTVLRAPGAERALELLQRRPVDLIVSDWDMPGMNGLAFVQALQADSRLADIPVILCTGVMTSSQDVATALLSGAVDYLRKPVDAVEFLARIRSSLELADAQRRLKALNQNKDGMFAEIAEVLADSVGQLDLALEMVQTHLHVPQQAQLYLGAAQDKTAQAKSLVLEILAWSRYRFVDWPVPCETLALRPVFEALQRRLELVYAPYEICVNLRCSAQLQVHSHREMLSELLFVLCQQLPRQPQSEWGLRGVVQSNHIRLELVAQRGATVPASPLGARMVQEMAHLLGIELSVLKKQPQTGFVLRLPVLGNVK